MGRIAQAFAAGAMLTMLADAMMPEAFEHGGKLVGIRHRDGIFGGRNTGGPGDLKNRTTKVNANILLFIKNHE